MNPTQIKEQVIELLAAGVSTAQIARAIGTSDSYVSQLKSDPDISEIVAAKAAGRVTKDVAFDKKLASAEELALQRIEQGLQFANLGQAVGAFRVLNAARKRKDATQEAPTQTINVTLTLPAAALPRYTLNSRSEIVDVEGKTMIAASPRTLESLLKDRAQVAIGVNSPVEQAKANTLLGALTQPRSAPRARQVVNLEDLL